MLWTLPVPIIHQKFFLAYVNLLIAKSDDLQSRKRGQSVQFFSFNFFLKSTVVLPRYFYFESTGTAVLILAKYRVPVPRYFCKVPCPPMSTSTTTVGSYASLNIWNSLPLS